MIHEPYVPTHISPDKLLHRQQVDPKLLVVDVRPRAAYDRGHVAGAVSLPVTDVPARWEIARGALLVVVYGDFAKDPDAEWAARFLGRQGLRLVMLLEGGHSAWTDDGLPTRAEMHVPRPPDRGDRVVSFPAIIRPEKGKPLEQMQPASPYRTGVSRRNRCGDVAS